MNYRVVTTFNATGYVNYGQKMIQTFLTHWPQTVSLSVYAENCIVKESAKNLVVKDIAICDGLTAFKKRWQHVPKANGNILQDPVRGIRIDAKKAFKWDAVRFAHKVYSIFHCAAHCTEDVLLWMDADMVCHSDITVADLDRLCPLQYDLCYLGRRGKFSECGLYSMKLNSIATRKFLNEFQRMYDQADKGIFTLAEWHDSYVFDEVRRRTPNLQQLNWSAHLHDLRPRKTSSPGEGHPLINCEWGAYLDHLKGDRKQIGRSLPSDLKLPRAESYWQ